MFLIELRRYGWLLLASTLETGIVAVEDVKEENEAIQTAGGATETVVIIF
jgi:hypothetical protein